MPIFRRSLRVHHLLLHLAFGVGVEDARSALRERIGGRPIREGKYVGGVNVLVVLGVVPSRLGEAVIEEAEAGARDVRHQALEEDAALLVLVKAEGEVMPQNAAA